MLGVAQSTLRKWAAEGIAGEIMERETVIALTGTFEAHAQQTDNGVEYWLARDLQYLLGYAKWDNFEGVVRRAANIIIHKHVLATIEQTTAVAQIGSGAQRNIVDYRLDRHAAVLVAELAQSHKLTNVFSIRSETVVLQLVQKYCRMTDLPFQHQFQLAGFVFDCAVGHFLLIEFDEPHHQASRRQRQFDTEKERVARENGWFLFRVALEMDIVDIIIAICRVQENSMMAHLQIADHTRVVSKTTAEACDNALFGKSTQAMKSQWKVPANRPLADFAPTIILKAKDFATEITIHNAREKRLSTERSISAEHISNNRAVRQTLLNRGIRPEQLPPAEDVKKVERRLAAEEKKSLKNPDALATEEGEG